MIGGLAAKGIGRIGGMVRQRIIYIFFVAKYIFKSTFLVELLSSG